MKAVLDACVLYPTVMRQVLLGVAAQGLFAPIWSDRLLEEWHRAAAKQGPVDAALAEGEITQTRAAWPEASTAPAPAPDLWLPDPADIHVLATARAAGADTIVTANLRDFPQRELRPLGIQAVHPDAFLHALHRTHPDPVRAAVDAVHAEAERLSAQPWDLRALLKKAGLPRLGKTLSSPRSP